ncbi:restriction endonuclease subunit S [Anaerobutyricum hallii]|jgi:type I restriction enzyme S subunit|uniref:restriction endonuclease subunit S n=1 Tax=Anaerobutyricum hallii TaxID=39488 RepID=UPI00242ECDF7|nr:restriction endonuclease subunit S [Anaerobutyricum hallii]
MAKVKSKKITLEEALVPVEEQPYEVPENWCWTYLLNGFAECKDGNRKPINASERAEREGDIPYYGATGQAGWIDDYLTDEQLVLLGEDGAPFLELLKDKAYLIEGKAWVNNHAHIIKSHYGEVGNKYILHYLNVFNFHGYVNGTTRLKLTQASMRTIPVPLPPLAEQKRIVEQIESLFAKLDEAKEKALSVVESFELREKAIYKKAFEGDLTNSWRAENGINISEWEEIPFEKLGKLERGRSKHRPRNDKRLFGGKYPFIQTGDVAGAGMYVTSHKQTLSEFGFEQSRMFPKGTLCITIAANIGDAAILSYDCCFPDSVVGFTPGEKCLNKYMYFYLQEIKAELEYIAPATAQKNLNLKLLGKVEIKVPSLKEQEKIVEILEKQINDQENIVEKAENVIETIDVMKKSILAKAFRGELGTNIETEESAIELLKSIF